MITDMNKEAIEDIMTRTSVRIYDSTRKVSAGDVDTILHAAMAAPTGVNKQPWAYVVVDEPDILKALAEAMPYGKMIAHCDVAICVCGDGERFLDGEDATLWVQDVSASAENILLAANACGLGAVWTCVYPHASRMEGVSRVLGLPENITPFCIIPLGYPVREPKPRDKYDESRIHRNRW